MQQRDLRGYGRSPPNARWPRQARLAVQFVLNVEEGAESSLVNGDKESEAYLHELPGRPPRQARDLSVESMYEYGSRAGFWRILKLFREYALPLTAFVAGRALELNPEAGIALQEHGHELAGHGYRWIDYQHIPEDIEREHIQRTIALIEQHGSRRPVGWYTGRVSANTRRLLREEGGFLYDSDTYSDDLPYWLDGSSTSNAHLLIPYTLVNNDCRYLMPTGPANAEDFFQLLRDAFDALYREGADSPKMMSIGLHGRISGHPARIIAIMKFLDYISQHDSLWVCTREGIAAHWIETHAPANQQDGMTNS